MSAVDLNRIRRGILKLSGRVREGHIPSAFSILEILSVLYSDVMDVDAIRRGSLDRDRFILSKGHGSLALYFILREFDLLSDQDIDTFCSFSGLLGGHPHRSPFHGIEASTGSLGHGFPIAVGLAMSLKYRESPARVYSLVGDGECNEGSIWEAALLAAHHRLSNLVCIVDSNHSGDRAVGLSSISQKFRSFDFDVLEVDGHDLPMLKNAFTHRSLDKPLAVIANTIKGHGLKPMENNPAWHHAFPTEDQISEFVSMLANGA